MKRKTWCEKLQDSKGLPRVEEITGKMSRKWGTGTIVIPAPLEVDELMKRVPEGKLTTINNIREALARKHEATSARARKGKKWVVNDYEKSLTKLF